MNTVEPSSMVMLAAAVLLLAPVFWLLMRRGAGKQAPAKRPEAPAPKFEPQAVRVLTSSERQAQQLLAQAMPGTLVLAQVPLSRFLRVQNNQPQWLQHVSGLSADLLLCDSASRVLVVVNVRSTNISEKSRKRHELMAKLLKSAGIKLLSWNDAALPDLGVVRQQLFAVLASGVTAQAAGNSTTGGGSRPVPLIPVAEIFEDHHDFNDPSMEPMSSAMFDDMEPMLTAEPTKR